MLSLVIEKVNGIRGRAAGHVTSSPCGQAPVGERRDDGRSRGAPAPKVMPVSLLLAPRCDPRRDPSHARTLHGAV